MAPPRADGRRHAASCGVMRRKLPSLVRNCERRILAHRKAEQRCVLLSMAMRREESCLTSVEMLAQGFITSNTLSGYAMFCGASRSAVERVALVSEKLLPRDFSVVPGCDQLSGDEQCRAKRVLVHVSCRNVADMNRRSEMRQRVDSLSDAARRACLPLTAFLSNAMVRSCFIHFAKLLPTMAYIPAL